MTKKYGAKKFFGKRMERASLFLCAEEKLEEVEEAGPMEKHPRELVEKLDSEEEEEEILVPKTQSIRRARKKRAFQPLNIENPTFGSVLDPISYVKTKI